MKQKPIPAPKPVYEDCTIQVSTWEGHPVMTTITADDIEEAAKAGVSLQDLIHIEQVSYRDWQCDC